MKIKLNFFIVLIGILFFLNFSAISFSKNKIIVLGTQKDENTNSGKFLKLVYTEAFNRLGIKFVYKQLPSKRSSFDSDSGFIDGELSRIYSYNEIHPNMIRVSEPHWRSSFLVASCDKTIKLNGWASLKNNNHKISYISGIKGCKTKLEQNMNASSIEVVEGVNQGLKKLLAGRSDLFICSKIDLVNQLNIPEFKNQKIYISGIMEKFTSHAFLHKKHKDIAAKLAVVLKNMKQEHLFKKYHLKTKILRHLNKKWSGQKCSKCCNCKDLQNNEQ